MKIFGFPNLGHLHSIIALSCFLRSLGYSLWYTSIFRASDVDNGKIVLAAEPKILGANSARIGNAWRSTRRFSGSCANA